MNRFASWPLPSIVVASIILACGGGGAAVDAVEGPNTPPDEAPPANPPTPAQGANVSASGTSFSPANISIAQGATVTWSFSGDRHNVTFGAAKPAGGDIPDTQPGSSVSRVFASAGSYPYQCTRHNGMTGQVIVGTGSSAPPTAPAPDVGTVVQATSSGFNPERAEITPGSTITWEFSQADGIVFEDDAPPGGNIPQTAAGGRASRTFPAEGDYDYHSLRNSRLEGRIRVR